MGSFPPTDPTYGDDCLLCYPAGKTPLTFAFSQAGVEKGQDWLPEFGQPQNGIHFFSQTINPCYWHSIFGPTGGERYFWYSAHFTQFIHEAKPGIEIFRADRGPGCEKFFTNDYDTPVGTVFWGGTVLLMPTWLAVRYISGYTPIVDPDPQFFFAPVPGNKAVIRYTDSWGDTNISMLVDLS